jgi:hypothetical protein
MEEDRSGGHCSVRKSQLFYLATSPWERFVAVTHKKGRCVVTNPRGKVSVWIESCISIVSALCCGVETSGQRDLRGSESRVVAAFLAGTLARPPGESQEGLGMASRVRGGCASIPVPRSHQGRVLCPAMPLCSGCPLWSPPILSVPELIIAGRGARRSSLW